MGKNEFIGSDQVRAVCRELGISDWTAKTDGAVDDREAETIQQIIGAETCDIPLSDFKHALEVELEHGTRFPDANVSNNHPLATGRIVLAHLKESLDYYFRLGCMELEMELTSALAKGDLKRALTKRRDLATARSELESRIAAQFSRAT